MIENDVIDISRQGKLSLTEANQILPIIQRFSTDYSQKVDKLIAQLEAVDNSRTDLIQELEAEINDLINSWHSKVRKLGGVPKGLWIVDFDSGDGYWCWKFPEEKVAFWHGYNEGFSARVPVGARENKEPASTESIFF